HRSFEGVAKFAQIPRPSIGRKDAARGLRKLSRGAIVNCRECYEEMLGYGNDVRAALAKRRNADGKNAEAEKQIFAKVPGGNGGVRGSGARSDPCRSRIHR